MDSTNETTPAVETSETVEQPDQSSDALDLNTEVEFDGGKVTLKELQDGYLRQSDYTRKTQELAEQRKTLETVEEEAPSDDVLNAREFLKSEGVITKKELQEFKATQENESKLKTILDRNPDLKQHESAIRAIWQTDNSAYEDIVVKYNFSTKDKLAKARAANSSIKWANPRGESKQKSIMDMSSEEYSKWKAENWVKGGSKFESSYI